MEISDEFIDGLRQCIDKYVKKIGEPKNSDWVYVPGENTELELKCFFYFVLDQLKCESEIIERLQDEIDRREKRYAIFDEELLVC